MKTSRESIPLRWRAVVEPGVPLKGLSTDSVTHKYSTKLWRRESSSKSTRDIWRKTELSGFRVKSGGAAVLWTKGLAGTIVLLLSPSPTQLVGK